MTLKMPIDIGSNIVVVGTRSGDYILRVAYSPGRFGYVAVNPNSFKARMISWKGWDGLFIKDLHEIRKGHPEFAPINSKRWVNRSYYILPTKTSPTGESFIWSKGKLERAEFDYNLVGVSANGLFAWLTDRHTGYHWLLGR